MSYKERISKIPNLSMDAIINNCRENTPLQFLHKPYLHPELNHGLDLLKSSEGLDCYISAYGEMHQSKCRAALQNLPFPPTDTRYDSLAVEIIDWGCGQGIGSICVIDFFKERDLTQWLRKITLIEPSSASLERAIANASKATNHRVRIVPINEYLPTESDNNEIAGINYEQRFVFHIFSNILDVEHIDLVKLARCMVSAGRTHYVLCMGPLNANAFRIDRFCEIFQPKEYFTDISSNNYGRTSDTNYCYTCKTKGFVYRGTSLDLTRYNPNEKAKSEVYSEYNIKLQISNGVISNNKAWVYYRLQSILTSHDLIYLNPDINGSSPDFVIVRPNVGIIVISVFEEDTSTFTQDVDNKHIIYIADNYDKNKRKRVLQSPYIALENYQNLIIENIKEFTEAVIENNRNLGLVKKVLICTSNTRDEAIDLLGQSPYTMIYGKEFIEQEPISRQLFDNLKFNYHTPIFDGVVLARLKRDLSPQWHSYRDGVNINLTTIQKKLTKSTSNSQQKISGVAGSGKTQVLATRAVNALIRTGGEVLLLTFNITLVNYMHMRLSQVRADFLWDRIHIDYYHRFFKKYAHLNNLHAHVGSYDDVDFFNEANVSLPKFDAILIDEVQDYLSTWLQILRRYFLKERGEFIVFGDPKQNIYHRDIDSQGDILLGIIPGIWNKTLTKGHRFSNPSLANLAMAFQRNFISYEVDNIETSKELTSENNGYLFNLLKYMFVNDISNEEETYKKVYDICKDFINSNNIQHNDVVILAPQTDILRYIDFRYRKDTGNKTTVTFAKRESIEKISKQNNQDSYGYKRNYDRLEKVEKNRFTMMTRHLKLSTIQSFKGWEAPTVICIIQKDRYSDANTITSPELIYTGITRSKENLLVINIDNDKYCDFFRTNMR